MPADTAEDAQNLSSVPHSSSVWRRDDTLTADVFSAYLDRTNQEQIALHQDMRRLQDHVDHRVESIANLVHVSNKEARARMDRIEDLIYASNKEARARTDRLDSKLDGIAKDVSKLRDDMTNVKVEIINTRAELKQDIANTNVEITSTRTELEQNITNTRTELKQDIANTNAEITNTRTELKQDISGVREDVLDRLEAQRRDSRAFTLAVIAALAAICGAVIPLLLQLI